MNVLKSIKKCIGIKKHTVLVKNIISSSKNNSSGSTGEKSFKTQILCNRDLRQYIIFDTRGNKFEVERFGNKNITHNGQALQLGIVITMIIIKKKNGIERRVTHNNNTH